MHKDAKTGWPPLWQKEVERLTLPRPIGMVQPGMAGVALGLSKGHRLRRPAGRIGIGPSDMGRICIGIVQFHRNIPLVRLDKPNARWFAFSRPIRKGETP